MPGTFTAVDLARLPFPAVVEPLDFETILAAMLADLRALAPDFDALVESDPAYKLLAVVAYRELQLRQRVNDAAKAVTLAYAAGADLDQIAARYNVARKTLTAVTATTAAVMESDADLRRRVQLAFEGLSVAGPVGAYIFHALGASPEVLDASATSPAPGEVLVTILSREGDGTPSAPVLADVLAALTADNVRPLTDHVTVQAAEVVPFSVNATLTLRAGPDAAVVVTEANARLAAYLEDARRLGRRVTRAALFAALCVEGVENVALESPAEDIAVADTQAASCTGAYVEAAA